jgi:methenyltetrahydromethanopterin cyclohydrolase
MADLNVGVRNANTYSGDRTVELISLSKSNMTQDELDAAIQHIQTTATVIGIGDDTDGGFNAGVSDVVHVLAEGGVPTVGADYGVGSTGVTAAVVAYFGNFNQG